MDIRTALESAFDADPAEKTEVVTEAATDPIAEKTDRARDEQGKFAKTEQPEQPIAAPVVVAPPIVERKAPSSWKPEAQVAWTKADKGDALTPEEVRLLAHESERREGDFHKGVQEFKTHSERARAYDQVIAPYQKTIESLGVDAPTAIGALLKADHVLRTADPATKAQYFGQLAQQYGIDLATVQAPAPQDPQTQFLMQQLTELRQNQQMWQNSVQSQQRAQANNELAEFAKAGHPHLDAVRDDMADLLETGKAKSMEQAYDMAVWMRPDIRQTLIEKQRVEAQRVALEQAQQQRAKSAAVSLKGSSPSSGGVQPNSGSLRETLEAAFANN